MSEGPDDAADPQLPLAGRRILIGVSGGIAAYKSPMLVRRLRDAGAAVQVVTTRGAEHFVTATTLQAVSGQVVRNDLWDAHAEAAMGHIELARWAELLMIAPATADLLSRLAAGRADDLLTTLRLATRSPVLLAPAMNVAMWEHPATRHNLERLRADGCLVAGPDDGPMACGEFGPGRMLEPEALLQRAVEILWAAAAATLPDLSGKRVLITAGPTREAIDPVRYISNHSSGKQGYAIAAAAARAGAAVTLVSGPVSLPTPPGVERVSVHSAVDMHGAVMDRVGRCDAFVGVAAVADFRPLSPAEQKVKKRADRAASEPASMSLELVENPDIIAEVARISPRPFVVGFAAETERVLEHGRDKRMRKGMDLIVVNDVSDPAVGFHSDDNAVTLIWEDGEQTLPRTGKAEVAAAVLSAMAEHMGRRSRST